MTSPVPVLASGDATAPWLSLARRLEGTEELDGEAVNPLIAEIFRIAGFDHADENTPWCAAFVGACLRMAGYQSTGTLAARDYLDWGAPLAAPAPGAVAVFWRVSPTSGGGHVGFVTGEDERLIYVLGGNQRDSINVTGYPKERLLGLRWPKLRFDPPQSFLAQLPAPPLPAVAAPTIDAVLTAVPVPPALSAAARIPATRTDAVPPLSIGDTGESVRGLQVALRNLNYFVGDTDGEYGKLTQGAVLQFQAENGLPPTGEVDGLTWQAIGRARKRELSPERMTATVETLRQAGSQTVETADWTRYAGIATAVLGALGFSDQQTGMITRMIASLKVATGATPGTTQVDPQALQQARQAVEAALATVPVTDPAMKPVIDAVRQAAVAAASGAGVAPGDATTASLLTPLLNLVPALLGANGPGTWLLALGLGLYTWRNGNRINALRVEDHRDGANLKR
jgi:uncharacterized protein (TIGR02594 family)